MKIICFIFIFLMSFAPGWVQAYSKSLKKHPSPEEVRSTMHLKKYMADFGTLVAGMEIMRFKEKKPDWVAIDITIQDLEETLQQMRAADKKENYKEFTDVLDQNLQEVKKYGKKRDKRVFESFDKLTHTCFKCHATHRPSDFPLPKKNAPPFGQKEAKLLFQR